MIRFVFSALLLCQAHGYAQLRVQLPCAEEPVPPYPRLDNSPVLKFWAEPDLGHDWKPPACADWAVAGFSTLITTTARIRHTSGVDGYLRRLGAISNLAGLRYWSTTHQQWRTLIVTAQAVTGAHSPQRRGDFTPDEMKEGAVLYYEQVDNLSGRATYRMRIREASEGRLVFDVENVTVMRYLLVTLFHPGEMQSLYFLDRESDDVWRYYSMARTGLNASRLTMGHESSSLNRAVAFYRYLAGIPSDQEPPAAR